MHIFGLSLAELRAEKWSQVLLWHREARRIGRAVGISMIQPDEDHAQP